MTESTPRFALPLIAAGQAQKEIAHNEALVLLDLLAQPTVEAIHAGAPPTAPVAGQAWIVGPAASGAWSGKEGMIALWSEGGWRFVTAREGMAVWVRDGGLVARRGASDWLLGGAIAAPVGGGTIDTQARDAIATMLATLRALGMIAG